MNDRLIRYKVIAAKQKQQRLDRVLEAKPTVDHIREFRTWLDSEKWPQSAVWNKVAYTLTMRYRTTVAQWYTSRSRLRITQGNTVAREVDITPQQMLWAFTEGEKAMRELR